MESHELERIRRSLAMSPSLPADVASDLVRDLAAIIEERRTLVEIADGLAAMAERVRALAQ